MADSTMIAGRRDRSKLRDDKLRRKLEKAVHAVKATKSVTSSLKKRKEVKDIVLKAPKDVSFITIDPVKASASGKTVAKLIPFQPLVVDVNCTVSEVCRRMAGIRSDVALVSNKGELCGIVTDKDIMRAVARAVNPSITPISNCMTASPLCIDPLEPAGSALRIMVERKFRHLPVVEGEEIIGLVDITRCLFDATARLEKRFANSKLLLEDSDIIGSGMTASFQEEFERLFKPTLETVHAGAVSVNIRQTVEEAAAVMVERNVNGLLITNDVSDVVGIFTSKDLVLRVVAASLAVSTTIVRVMTPSPDVIDIGCSIFDAINKMSKYRYLHLPVADKDHKIVGMCDVLTLSHHLLKQSEAAPTEAGVPEGHGFQFWSKAFALKPTEIGATPSVISRDDVTELSSIISSDDEDEDDDLRVRVMNLSPPEASLSSLRTVDKSFSEAKTITPLELEGKSLATRMLVAESEKMALKVEANRAKAESVEVSLSALMMRLVGAEALLRDLESGAKTSDENINTVAMKIDDAMNAISTCEEAGLATGSHVNEVDAKLTSTGEKVASLHRQLEDSDRKVSLLECRHNIMSDKLAAMELRRMETETQLKGMSIAAMGISALSIVLGLAAIVMANSRGGDRYR